MTRQLTIHPVALGNVSDQIRENAKKHVQVITRDEFGVETIKHIIWNNADREWLNTHLHWAFHNEREVTLRAID